MNGKANILLLENMTRDIRDKSVHPATFPISLSKKVIGQIGRK